MWHIETDVFAIFIMGILIFKNRWLQAQRSEQDRMISWMLWCSLGLTVIDLVSSIVMNGYGGWLAYQITLTAYYATATMLACLWLLYGYMLIDGGHLRMTPARFVIAVLPQLIMSLVALSNHFTSAVFTLTRDMEYSRGPLFKVFSMLYLIYYPVVGLLTIFIYRRQIQPRSNRIAMTLFFIIIPLATTIQLYAPGTLLISISFAVIFLIDDMTIETERRNRLLARLEEQNRQLEEAVQTAESANAAKGQFLSRISHDIRTPIGAILNLTEFAKEDKHDEQKLDADLDKIATSGRFLLSLINDVLDISKIDSGKIELKPQRYAYTEYLSEIRNMILPMCAERDMACEICSGVPEQVVGMTDKVRLNQITLNLLSNAVKYTPKGGHIRFATSSEEMPTGRIRFTFSVEDDGIGMSEEFQRVMFDEFAREENNPLRMETIAGTGLGLPIVKRLVDLMGGEIEVESALGKGTKVTVHLPMELAPQEDPAAAQAADVAGEKRVRGRILLAEDNEINIEIALRIFEDIGVTVDHAPNGQEEVALFASSAPGYYDAVFTDIQMPVMNGYEAAAAIRALDREDASQVPIIAMTADAFADAMQRAHDAGMTDFVTKPLNRDELRKILEEILEGK